MYKIAVLGDRNSVLGFKALGLDIYPVEEDIAIDTLNKLTRESYAIIYITEDLALKLAAEIEPYRDHVTPAIIVIPGKNGSLGTGMASLKRAVERAVGADILNTD